MSAIAICVVFVMVTGKVGFLRIFPSGANNTRIACKNDKMLPCIEDELPFECLSISSMCKWALDLFDLRGKNKNRNKYCVVRRGFVKNTVIMDWGLTERMKS